ncbi:MAG: 3-phenylpropionate/trans-cinnamate dioxygenase ferredoxin reductase component [Actinomycetota bacterium]|nr:3-phenylpropionate/trans-cinnamate dioxygenase ferredoxin reductase component [Actinomycetota bacterium]
MTDRETYVVVGAGLAGAKTVEALRAEGFDGRLVLLGAEPHRPYERPPLSKGYLAGTAARDKAFVHPEQWYAEHDVELRTGTTVTELDPGASEVLTSAGDRVAYDRLVLATGSSPRRLSVPGADLPSVAYLRSIDDSERIRAAIRPGARIVLIGGGWIGLEVAAVARQADADVTILEGAELPLFRVLGRDVATVFAELHRQHGVDLRCEVSVTGIEADGSGAAAVRLADGAAIGADLVVVGVGIAPNISLAEQAGLTVDNGVLVDASLRTSDPHVFAVGDVANALHPGLGRHLRVEHWANALHQPAVAAKAMLGGNAVYDRLPYFFTDQYDAGMEYFGYAEPDEVEQVVVRGVPDKGAFAAFWLGGGHVLAGMHVNQWDDADAIKAIVRNRRAADAALGDVDTPLDQLAGG